jgi:hypothetical protein
MSGSNFSALTSGAILIASGRVPMTSKSCSVGVILFIRVLFIHLEYFLLLSQLFQSTNLRTHR